jgi:hypothetical protein
MKKVLGICLLIFALAFPVFGGHTQSGNLYCDCGTPGCVEDFPGECGRSGNAATPSNEPLSDSTAELGIVIVALLLWLRLKA